MADGNGGQLGQEHGARFPRFLSGHSVIAFNP
jgi:hypothetical protein